MPPIVGAMKMTANGVRGLSVALLLGALLNHGIIQSPNPGPGQETGGLLRLARDLMRRTGGEQSNELSARDFQRVIDQGLDLVYKPHRVRQLRVPVEG